MGMSCRSRQGWLSPGDTEIWGIHILDQLRNGQANPASRRCQSQPHPLPQLLFQHIAGNYLRLQDT